MFLYYYSHNKSPLRNCFPLVKRVNSVFWVETYIPVRQVTVLAKTTLRRQVHLKRVEDIGGIIIPLMK